MSTQASTMGETLAADPPPRRGSASDNERRILERLQGVSGCPRLVLDPVVSEPSVEDPGGLALDQAGLLGRVDLARFLGIAESLARLLAAIHARGVMHRRLDPGCIRIQPEDDRLWILDFTGATSVVEMPGGFASPGRLAGHPAYRAPEQSRRMNRPIDARADLYALGCVLYALATGEPPFRDSDPIALIHAHLARDPEPPLERAPWMPRRLSRLILILLAKEPDDRYQSASGLVHDLQCLRRAIAAHQPLGAVRLRTRDPVLSPLPPRRLHGRERELATLMACFRDAAQGQARALFVRGYSGVGKTALIQEIHRPVTLSHGLFASGKCEQFQPDRPFLAPARALGRLCELLLAEPDDRLVSWRQRILEGLGPDASALFGVVPELEGLLGAQPAAPPLGPRETQIRRRALLLALVRQIASPARPLVLFLDDLQWADRPTLDFIAALLEETSIQGLLLLGAYRDNEVDAEHPLAALLRQPASADLPPPLLTLANLTPRDLAGLVAEMLRLKPAEVRPLAVQLHGKTGGNPFFVLELVVRLYRQGLLWLDPEQGRWLWREAALSAQPVSDNLVEFLATGLAELDGETSHALLAAACLGNDFSLGDLALATGVPARALADSLMPVFERGILVTPDVLALQVAEPGVRLRFCHDRMQQAAYRLGDEAGRAALNLAMARRFAAAGTDPAHRFSAAEHYATAVSLITEAEERGRARELLLQAARRASRSGALATAERFLRLGIELLGQDPWMSDPEAAFGLYSKLHRVLYSQARHADADAVFEHLLEHVHDPLLLAEPSCVQIANLSSRALYHEAIAWGCDLLERLEMPVPKAELDLSLRELLAKPRDVFRVFGISEQSQDGASRAAGAVERELMAFYRYVDTGAVERLPGGPDLTDDRLVSAASIMNSMGMAAASVHPLLLAWIQARLGRLWIEEGYCEAAIYPLAALGLILIGLRGDFATAERLAKVALEVGAAREGSRETARAWFVYSHYVGHWVHPLEENLAHARFAFDELVRAGDLEFASFTWVTSQSAVLDLCSHLDEMHAECEAALSFVRKTENRRAELGYLIHRQLIRALEGRTAGPGSFADAELDERDHQAMLQQNPVALCYFHIHRALSACLFNDDEALVRHAEEAVALATSVSVYYAIALANLLLSLSLIQRLRTADESERSSLLDRLSINQRWLAARAADVPMNFAHLHDLIEAERLDALGEPWAALQCFERAMRAAQGHRRPWHHAFITERAGLCQMRHGLEHAGRALLTRAHQLYLQWGATGKARAMRRAWPFIGAEQPLGVLGGGDEGLDQAALLQAAEALATETSPTGLVERVMRLVVRSTGATDARFLVLDEEGQWSLEGGLRGDAPLGRLSLARAEDQGLVPASLLRLGIKTQRPLVCDDALLDSRFALDPYFAGLPLCSLLGLPVVVQGRVSAFLILENRRLRAAFAAERVVDLLGGVAGDVPLLQSLRLASLGGLVALHSVLETRSQSLRDAQRTALAEATRERALRDQQSRFIDLVTHEYRTPLAILKTNLDILTLSQDPAHWRESLCNMDLAIQRLAEVFDGSLRRGDWGEHRRIHLQPLELSGWLARCLDEIRHGWPAPAPPIEWRSIGPAWVQADPALLKTVVINLLDNARKYGVPGHPILIDVQASAGRVVLRVGNACQASPERDAAELLSRRVRGANSQGIPGLGMGLYLVERLVGDQGGRVELGHERPDDFEVRLILTRAEPETMG